MTISRRGLLVGAGAALAGLGAAGPAFAATPVDPEEHGGTPATLGVLRTVLGSERIERLDEPMTHLGLSWTGSAPRLRLRTATGWQDRVLPAGCGGGRDDRDGRDAVTLAVSGAVGYEIIDAGEVRVSEIDVTTGPLRPRDPAALELTTLWDRPLPRRYRNRASWGADESLRFDPDGTNRFPDAFFPAQTITVHHTAMKVGDEGPAAQVRAVYHDHTITRDFGDIGYHLLIDGDGTVYEGRSSGADPIPVFGGGLHRPLHVNNAAHVGGFNAGNLGVALLGDFTSAPPTREALDALVQVLAILCAICRLDPLGRTDYVNPISGATRQIDTISGHRDWAATECPGNQLHPLLPALRRRVADRARAPELRG